MMYKFLLGLGFGLAGKWLYDTWQEAQAESEATLSGWHNDDSESRDGVDTSATMNKQTDEVTFEMDAPESTLQPAV